MSPGDARRRLAVEQAEVVRALTGQGPPPAGFDLARLQAAAGSLERKRGRAVLRAWPALGRALGEAFPQRFAAYAASRPLPRRGGPLADGWAFAQTLAEQGDLPDGGRIERLAVALRQVAGVEGLSPRRGPALRCALLRQPRRWVVAVRLPWFGEHWFSLPLSRGALRDLFHGDRLK